MKGCVTWLRWRIDKAVNERVFFLLIRHFARRAIGGGDAAGDVDLGLGGALAILALPGAFTALGLTTKYGALIQWLHGTVMNFHPYRECIPDEYFFLTYSMAVAGFITILRWDHLLPGRRDFVNLAPLPLALKSVFLSNLAALGLVALVFTLDVNAFSGFYFPLLVTWRGSALSSYMAMWAAHWVAVMGISLFTILAILALQGLLMALLPDALYRRASLAVRAVLLIFFFALLVSAFIFPLSVVNFNLGSRMAGAWWPPVWFLSFFESLLSPLKASSPMGAAPALIAMGLVLLLVTLSFALSYRRYFLRIAERPDGMAQPSRAGFIPLRWLKPILRIWLRPGAETATFQFVVKTILRNETHLLFAGLWVGIALLLSLEGLTGVAAAPPGSGAYKGAMLAAPLIFSFGVIAGLRFVFDIPATTESNWIFRLLAADGAIRLDEVAKWVILAFTIPPVVLIWLPLAWQILGAEGALAGIFLDLPLLVIGVDLLVMKYGKIPCTCLFTANRDRMLRLLLICAGTLLFGIPLIVRIEGTIVLHPLRLLLFGPALIGAIALIESNKHGKRNPAVFEDRGAEPLALLRLSGE
ncbi:MAG TPA: hypothetical protein VN633_09445 [Bryobacteraceae bacterium]|nr:hypothetical protein [Bryobacteraceae bacterium]